jgi:hypothetical protein
MIRFQCANCGKEFSVPDGVAGRFGKCNQCGQRNQVPSGAAGAATTVASPSARAIQILAQAPPPAPIQTVVVVERFRYGGNSLAIASIILGVLAFLSGFVPLFGLSSIPVAALGGLLGVLGLVMAVFRKGGGAGFSIAGMLLSLLVILITYSMTTATAGAVAYPGTAFDGAVAEPQAAIASPIQAPNSSSGPQWTSARDAVQHQDVRVKVTSIKVDFASIKSIGDTAPSDAKLLLIGLHVENLSDVRRLDFRGFAGQLDFSADTTPHLTDNFGNKYKRISSGIDAQIVGQVQNESVYPGKSIDDLLVFEVPVDKVEFLHLKLSAGAFGANGTLQLEIPRDMIAQ